MKYNLAEQQFLTLLDLPNLDSELAKNRFLVREFEDVLEGAIASAYSSSTTDPETHLFLQRILYHINRLNLFWHDDLQHYTNDNSAYLQEIRNRIESPWQEWELKQLNLSKLQSLDVEEALRERYELDVDPPLSESDRYIREEITEAGYQQLLAVLSLDGLVEGSRIPYLLGGAASEVQSTLTRIFMEEYGNGRLSRKHSTFFVQMLNEFGMNTEPEGYLDIIPWEALATVNHGFFLVARKRHFLRYNGGLTYFEISVPAIHRNYVAAGKRLGLPKAAMSYWELHIREDERHGLWMLEDVALPLAKEYPEQAWELLLGYDQEKLMGDRAGNAMLREIKKVDKAVRKRELVNQS